jgi:hypothetical protein
MPERSNVSSGAWLIPYHERGLEYFENQIIQTRALIAELTLRQSAQLTLFDYDAPPAD